MEPVNSQTRDPGRELGEIAFPLTQSAGNPALWVRQAILTQCYSID